MKQQELDQLRQKSLAELRNDLAESERKLIELRLNRGQRSNVRELAHLKKKRAQLQSLAQAKKA